METDILTDLVRETMLEDIWYPADPDQLMDEIHRLRAPGAQSLVTPSDRARGSSRRTLLILPAAPLDEIGRLYHTACDLIRSLEPQRVILLAFANPGSRQGIYLPESHAYATPFGLVECDPQGVQIFLDSSTLAQQNDLAHLESNGLELFTLFLHYLLPQTPMVPLIIKAQGDTVFRALAGGTRLMESEVGGPTVVVGFWEPMGGEGYHELVKTGVLPWLGMDHPGREPRTPMSEEARRTLPEDLMHLLTLAWTLGPLPRTMMIQDGPVPHWLLCMHNLEP